MNCALYLRLSNRERQTIEHRHVMSFQGESSSISSQRLLLQQYMQQQGWESTHTTYIDDGYSGLSLQRPALNQLFEDISNKQIDCILVKDFSRFSRDSLTLCQLLEVEFPHWNVRFISVNDHYDSHSTDTDHRLQEYIMKTILYEHYSLELSDKVKLAQKNNRKQGKPSGGSCPYGYHKRPDGIHYEIDETAADVLRTIYKLSTFNEQSPTQIAAYLNRQRIPTPAQYKRQSAHHSYYSGKNTAPFPKQNPTPDQAQWNAPMVRRLLHDERYRGTQILWRYESCKIGSNQVRLRPREEWIRLPDTLPCIFPVE